VEHLISELDVTHLLGFPVDFNGNLRRASSEAVYTARQGVRVNFAVSTEGARIAFREILTVRKTNDVKVIPLYPLLPRRVAPQISWRVNNLIALPLQALKFSMRNTILHVHAPTPVFKPFSLSLVNKLSKRLMVLDIHDPWSGHPFPVLGLVEMQLRTELMRYAIKSADSVVVAHTALIKPVREINPRVPINVIPNGVDVELFRPQPRNVSIAKKLGVTDQDIVIAFSGHITDEKGLDVLVKSAATLVRSYRNIKFLIVGDGGFLKEIKTLVSNLKLEDKFIFVGFLSGDQLPDYLSLADICVAPYMPGPWYEVSKVETPLKVVEYMALGKPVVMSRISEENVLTWGNGGLLVTPGDVSELTSSLISLIEDEKLRNSLGENGRRFIEKEYSWQKITKKLISIYRSLNEK